MAFTQVTIVQDYTLADGSEPSGTVTFTPTAPMYNSSVVVPQTPAVARLAGGTGTINVTLVANTDSATTPAGVSYKVDELINGVVRTYNIQVPHDQGSSLTLYELTQLSSPPGLSFPAAAQSLSNLERARRRLLEHAPEGDAEQRVGVPLYVFPDYASTPSTWNTIAATAPASRFVIANPNTGPGSSIDSFYDTQIQRMQASGVLMLGYVSTHYATVAYATVLADVQKWVDWYGIDGIFLDETAYNSDQAHYQRIYDAIKRIDSDLIVVSNPGLGVDVSMEPTSDVFMSFEGDPTAYRARPGVAAPAWERTAPSWRFWHLVHSVTSLAEAQEMLTLSQTYRAGTIFVTDQTMPNPWLGLPSANIWSVQVEQAETGSTGGVVALTDAATIATDASLGDLFRVTLGGNRTLGNPTNPTDGQTCTWELIQDATGGRTLTLGSAFALGTTIASTTLTTTASKRDFLTAVYNSTTAKWYCTQFVKGY